MRLRLFFRGEKEYRPKRPRPHRVDTDGDTESEPEEKKIERRKKKFRLDIHDDQVGALFRNFSMFRPLSIHRTQSTCGNLKQLIPTHGSEVGLIFVDFFVIMIRYCNYYHWFRWLSLSPVALATSRWCVLPLLGRSRLCWFRHRFSYL